MKSSFKSHRAALALAVALLATTMAMGQGMTGAPQGGTTQPPPDILKRVGIEQKLNQQLPLDLVFRDETGKQVKLGDYFGKRPVVLSMVYYDCPMLCGEVMNGEASVFSTLKFDVGKDFDVLTVSFDPRETPALAAAKKHTMITRYGRPGAAEGWHFLTGDQANIQALTNALGFQYAWDEQTKQFAHAASIMVITPQGKIAQYLYGVEYAPRDLRLALVQSSQNKIGNVVDQVLLYCYHYDPRTGKYGAIVSRVLQVAGVFTIVVLGGFLIVMFRLEPRTQNGGSDRGGKA
ncbi:MAG TPA: SCO family protein [Terriglobales bacterium]|nr:SCO family protein [Terriglobales bacterium]